MNLAFAALLVAALAAPGAFFLESYRRGFGHKPVQSSSFQSNLFLYLIFAAPMHVAAWLSLTGAEVAVLAASQRRFSLLPVPASTLFTLIVGGEAAGYDAAVAELRDALLPAFAYAVFAGAVAAILGVASHAVVRRLRLDVRYPILNPQNAFWKLFTSDGKALSRRGYLGPDPVGDGVEAARLPDFTFITLSVDQGGTTWLYWGRLVDFDLGPGNELRRVILTDARRRAMDVGIRRGNDRDGIDPKRPMLPIRGDLLVIEYARVITMNVEYVWLRPVSEEELEPGIDVIDEAPGDPHGDHGAA